MSTAYVGKKGKAKKKRKYGFAWKQWGCNVSIWKEANAVFLSKLSLLQTSTRPYSLGGLARVTLLWFWQTWQRLTRSRLARLTTVALLWSDKDDNLEKGDKVSGWQRGKVKKKCQCSQSDQTNTDLNNVTLFDVRLANQAVKCKLRNGLVSTWHMQ